MSKNQKGFAHWLLILLILLILLLIGFIGWRVYSQKKPASSGKQDSAQQAQPAEEETEEYVNKTVYFSLQKPKKWTVSEQKQIDESYGENSKYYVGDVIFKSPTGTKLTVNFGSGGFGGACEPEADDKPFAENNICPSHEYTKVKNLNVDNNTNRLVDKAYLVRAHIMLPDGTQEYQICLETHSDEYKPEENKPYTGFIISCAPFGTTEYSLFIETSSSDKNLYDSADAKAIETMLATFKLLPFVP